MTVALHDGPGTLRNLNKSAGIRTGRILRRISDAGGEISRLQAKGIRFSYIPIMELIKT